MEALIEFLKTNYIYFVFVAVLLILALIGYIVDSTKSDKKKVEKEKKTEEEEFTLSIPEVGNAKIGETVNKNAGIVTNEIPSIETQNKKAEPVELKKPE